MEKGVAASGADVAAAAAPSPDASGDHAFDAEESVVFAGEEEQSSADPVEQQEEEEEDDDDGFLDVVVTSVDAADASGAASSVTQAIASSLSTSGLHAYTVQFVVTKGATSYCIHRPLPALFDVLRSLEAATPKVQLVMLNVNSDDSGEEAKAPETSGNALLLPEFPPKGSRNDSLIAQWCGEMTAYLAGHRCGMLQLHPDWLAFVAERDEDKGARAHMTAIDFILQPFPFEKFYVPRGSRHEVVVAVKAKKEDTSAQFIVWKFELEDLDVDFSVSFAPEPYEQPVEIVHARTRYVATPTGRAIEGMHQCPRPGRATLVKNVLYQVQVVSSSIMDSATAAADALDEAVQAEKQRDRERAAALSTALIVSPGSPRDAPSSSSLYSQYLQQSWLLNAPMNVAGHLASRLFSSQEETAVVASTADQSRTDSEARSLLEELNGLNMQLMERMVRRGFEFVARLTVDRDQARSKTHLAVVEKENLASEVKAKELELASLGGELTRIQREREAWRDIQIERDALLEEKHRWAMTDDFDGGDDEAANLSSEMDSANRNRLEQELGQAEAAVLRCRAELGYSLSNHLTGTSTRLEKIVREMTTTKQSYEEQMQTWGQERLQLTQQLVKARGQKRVLVTELRNMRTQTEGQVAVAMAEASEARMVNRRLKKQNELLLTQIRTLINEAEENERKLQETRDRLNQQQKEEEERTHSPVGTEDSEQSHTELHDDSEAARQVEARQSEESEEDSPVPYTLSEDDIALLNGRRPPSASARAVSSTSNSDAPTSTMQGVDQSKENPYRSRLVAFLEERDPEKLAEVDEMLANYRGVEESLFESLELKYSFMELNQRIAQAL
ncbi:hypothetical protein BBJ28_00022956 [Nothophytophthora sp. Chile5]|nr:hypothetical protein BBJ28_00022956 [Nothophytophthora sp. Chile5]